ncbi:MAG: ABC transporter permease, partial [Bacilli bacterium]|nr:ABC transporter permease [Bacilli bacterium]
FAFPIILGTFFCMAFSDIEKNEKLDVFSIAIVDDENFSKNVAIQKTFETLSDENNEDRLFSIEYVDVNKAVELLNKKDIVGYVLVEDTPKVVVSSSGVNETILQFVVDEVIEQEVLLQDFLQKEVNDFSSFDFQKTYQEIMQKINGFVANVKDVSKTNLSYTMIEYYTLIAMTCLYGGILGMTVMNQNLANMSSKGKRIAACPTSKWTIISSSVLASFVVQLIGLALLFLYTIFILKVDYGHRLLLVVLLAIVGSFAGLTLGVAVASFFKTNENTKVGIVLAFTMLGSFLSGMMGITMKYIVDKNMPILNRLNPANMITDGLYALYYYDTLDRFYLNLFSLLLFAGVMIALSLFSLRRQKYDSI